MLYVIKDTSEGGVNKGCSFTTARMRILDVFYQVFPLIFPRCGKFQRAVQRLGLTTKLTPTAVSTVPSKVVAVITSPNRIQAKPAVVGGTR
jgi:hypothetical protein